MSFETEIVKNRFSLLLLVLLLEPALAGDIPETGSGYGIESEFNWIDPYDDDMWVPVDEVRAKSLCAHVEIEANRLLCVEDAQQYGIIAKWWAKYSSDRTLHIADELRYQEVGKDQGLTRLQFKNKRTIEGSKVKSVQPVSVQLHRKIEVLEIEIGKMQRYRQQLINELNTLEKGH